MAAPPVVGGQHAAVAGATNTLKATPPTGNTQQNTGFRNVDLGGNPAHAAANVRATQQFLNNHGFQVTQDGVWGPQTASAAAAFRANHASGSAWSAAHGITVHPAKQAGGLTHPGTVPPPNTRPGATKPAPPVHTVGAPTSPGSQAFNSLMAGLLQNSGRIGNYFDPQSAANAAAAPQDAVAQALARQVAQNPAQENQNQSDISSWYGLNPTASSYQLSVLGRLGTATSRDAQAATDASGNISDIAKSLVGSIGGAANAGSGSVAAAGADAAGTAAALGEVSKQYGNDMAPLIAAEARGQMSKEKAANQNALLSLRDQQAQAAGQAWADSANAQMGVNDKNNALAQQRFADEGNLLSTLAQQQAIDPNANPLKDAKLQAQINAILQGQSTGVFNANTGRINATAHMTTAQAAAYRATHPNARAGSTPKLDIGKATQGIINQLGYTVGPSGQPMVPTADHQRLATTIGAFLRSQGFRPGDGQFKKLGDTILSSFVDEHGRPIQAPPTWAI